MVPASAATPPGSPVCHLCPQPLSPGAGTECSLLYPASPDSSPHTFAKAREPCCQVSTAVAPLPLPAHANPEHTGLVGLTVRRGSTACSVVVDRKQ